LIEVYIIVMKRLLLFLLLLIPFVSKAQNYVQAGPSVYPMGSWGAEIVGDFKVTDITPKLSFGIGVMAFASSGKTHEEPTPDQTVREYYGAPQLNLRYSFSRVFDIYLRGGAGWYGSKKEEGDLISKFMANGMVGAGFSLLPFLGLYAEIGLPFSSLGVRFAF